MNSSYKLSQEAKDDLQSIYEYGFLNFGEQQADDYFFSFFETFEKIAPYSLHYQSVDDIRVGYKRCIYRSDAIYFRVNGQKVEIMAIIGGQDTDV